MRSPISRRATELNSFTTLPPLPVELYSHIAYELFEVRPDDHHQWGDSFWWLGSHEKRSVLLKDQGRNLVNLSLVCTAFRRAAKIPLSETKILYELNVNSRGFPVTNGDVTGRDKILASVLISGTFIHFYTSLIYTNFHRV